MPEASGRRAVAAVLAVAGLVIVGDVTILSVYLRSDGPVSPIGVIAVAASLVRIGVSLVTVRHASAFRRREAVPAPSPVGRDARR